MAWVRKLPRIAIRSGSRPIWKLPTWPYHATRTCDAGPRSALKTLAPRCPGPISVTGVSQALRPAVPYSTVVNRGCKPCRNLLVFGGSGDGQGCGLGSSSGRHAKPVTKCCLRVYSILHALHTVVALTPSIRAAAGRGWRESRREFSLHQLPGDDCGRYAQRRPSREQQQHHDVPRRTVVVKPREIQ
jgi:hypothetical protein